MGLKERKVKTMIEEYSKHCIDTLNQNLGSNFNFEINWEIITERLVDCAWEDEKFQESFLANYFAPFEVAFKDMFTDEMYKEAILEQVKTIKIEPGRSGCIDWSYENGDLTCSHVFNPSFTDIEKNAIEFTKMCGNDLRKTLEAGLS